MKVLIFGMPSDKRCTEQAAKAIIMSHIRPQLINIKIKPEIALKYKVDAYPLTVIIKDNGDQVRLIGDIDAKYLRAWFKENLKND